MDTLALRAAEPGQEALAARLADPYGSVAALPGVCTAALAALAALMPLQPPTATGTRDSLLAALEDYDVGLWTEACQRKLPDGRAGCVMVVADLLPLRPGEEAMVILNQSEGYVPVLGVYLGDSGALQQRSAVGPDGQVPDGTEALALLGAYQAAPPPATPAMINQLGTGEDGLMILP